MFGNSLRGRPAPAVLRRLLRVRQPGLVEVTLRWTNYQLLSQASLAEALAECPSECPSKGRALKERLAGAELKLCKRRPHSSGSTLLATPCLLIMTNPESTNCIPKHYYISGSQQGGFCPREIFSVVTTWGWWWKCCYWHLMGQDQECCQTPFNAHE